jgi:N-methylhydantoinase B/oxoprolinase/acetone carboxylase alpha subunit
MANKRGRPKGSPNKATAEIKEIAQQYGAEAISELWGLAKNAQSEQARVSAIKEILDRAYGKATQTIAGDKNNPLYIHSTKDQRDAATAAAFRANT